VNAIMAHVRLNKSRESEMAPFLIEVSMDEIFENELHVLVKKYKLEDLYGIPDYLIVEWMMVSLDNMSTFMDRLEEFRDSINEELLEAAAEKD